MGWLTDRQKQRETALRINHLVQELRSLGCAVMWFREDELGITIHNRDKQL